MTDRPAIAIAPAHFADWGALRALLALCFAPMAGRIDPPSSLDRLTEADLAAKACSETLLLGMERDRPLACGFLAPRSDALYLGKLAVHPDFRRLGLLRDMVEVADAIARARSVTALELQTRVELTETHRAFEALGFVVIGSTCHPGFDRPTSFTMRRQVRTPPFRHPESRL